MATASMASHRSAFLPPQDLGLSQNRLRGPLPASWSALRSITSLTAANNRLTGVGGRRRGGAVSDVLTGRREARWGGAETGQQTWGNHQQALRQRA